MKELNCRVSGLLSWISLLLVVACLGVPWHVSAVGSWVPLNNKPLSGRGGLGPMLLLPDGRVMGQFFGGTNWYMLTPDTYGSYTNGNWTTLPLMVGGNRQFCSTAVLRDGRVFVAGGEYGGNPAGGNSGSTAEVYDPVANNWTLIPVPNNLINTNSPDSNNGGFRDSVCTLLPNGNVMIAPVFPIAGNGTVLFDPVLNSLSAGPAALASQNEVCWVKLPDDSILTIDQGPPATTSERFIPSLNRWIADKNLPVQLYDATSEIGAGLLLPDGRVFFLGGTGPTAFYTPSGNTNLGSWVQGPNIPGGMVNRDAPAAMMVNGKILCALSSATNTTKVPVYFYEFDPATTNFTQINGPSGGLASVNNVISDWYAMLALPDGNILVSDDSAPGNQGAQLYLYVPDGTPLAAGKPTISSVTANGNGSYHLIGTRLNGISQGAAYGDEMQMDSNYPLVRLVADSGEVTYARTFNWSSTGVQTGNQVVSTEFTPPPVIAGSGAISLVVVANGISSDPVPLPLVRPGETLTFSGNASMGDSSYEIRGGTTEVQHGSPGVTSTLARTAGGKIQLLNSATAATATIIIGGGPGNGGSGGVLEFRDQTTAAAATITSGPGVLGPNFDELSPNPIDGFGGAANFYDTSLAGTARFTNNGEDFRGGTGGSAGFFKNASADQGVFNNKAATANLGRGGVTQFTDTATAGFATFINDGASVISDFSGVTLDFSAGKTIFYLSSSAGHGTFTNKAALPSIYGSGAGATRFLGTSSAASGTFINEGAGYQIPRGVTQFFANSTAGTGTFINLAGANWGGAVEFYDQSTAGDGVFVNDTTSSTLTAGGEFSFNDNSTAGTGHFSSTGTFGGHVTFNNQSSADYATIMLTPNQPNNRIDFRESSTAGNSILQIGAGGLVAFQGTATAANATITIGANDVGTLVSSGQAQGAFYSGTAGNAQITVRGGETATKLGSILSFWNFIAESTAGNATIAVAGAKNGGLTGGSVIFNTGSHAGNATLIASGEANADLATAATISFRGGAQGDLCRVIADTGGWFDCSGNALYGGTAIGSIEGAGRISLGAALLTVGRANTSTIFLGPITQGEGYTPGIGGRLTKTGTGALTLAGVNTYTGLTTINAGTLAVNGSLAGGVQVNAGATLKGTGTIAGTVTVAAGGSVAPGNSPGTLTIGKDYQGSQGILEMEVAGPNPENQDLLIVNGNVNLGGTLLLIFSGFAPSANETFPVLEATGNLSVNNLNIVVLGLKPGFQPSYQVSGGKLILTATSSGQLRTTDDPIQGLAPFFTPQSGFVYPVFTLAGATYQFDTSTDLKSWTPVSVVPGANKLVEFRQIPPASDARRFYRVIQVSGTL